MFFALSKILLFLIQPICWIFFLFLLAIITKRNKLKRRLIFAAFSVLYIFSNPFILNQFAKIWDITQAPHAGKYSCAIVLGGFASADKDGNGYFNGSSDRFIETLKLKTTGKVSKILMSGGNGQLIKTNNFREADYVFSQFKAFNIPDSSILVENRSRNTLENAMFSKRILIDKKVPGPYLLVTSAFHMRRSIYTFKKVGIKAVAYPCDFIAGKGNTSLSDLILPDPLVLSQWNIYIKEVVGFVAYYFKAVPAINPPGQL